VGENHFKVAVSDRVSGEHYELLQKVGHGAFGTVWAAVDHRTKEPYSIKVLDVQHTCEMTGKQPMVLEEAAELPEHPFIVTFHGAFSCDQSICFVLQWAGGGDVYALLQRLPHQRCSAKAVRFYAAEIALALTHLHNHRIVYHDLRPENILLDHQGHVMLSDVALAKADIHAFDSNTVTLCGTLDYLAPEIVAHSKIYKEFRQSRHVDGGGGRYGWVDATRSDGVKRAWPVIDWWAFGVLLYELLAGLHCTPFHVADNPRQTFHRIVHEEVVAFPPFFTVYSMHLIQRLLIKDPRKRMGADGSAQVQNDIFFGGIEWESVMARRSAGPYTVSPSYDMEAAVKAAKEGDVGEGSSSLFHPEGAAALGEGADVTLRTLSASEHCFRRAKMILKHGRHVHEQLNSVKLQMQLSGQAMPEAQSDTHGRDPSSTDLKGARSTFTATLKPGQLKRYCTAFGKAVREEARWLQGYKASRLVTDEQTNMAVAIVTWESETAMQNARHNGYHQKVTEALEPLTESWSVS